jgi:hypothetical protein
MAMRAMAVSSFPKNRVRGLVISANATYPTYQVDIAAGECRCDSDACDLNLTTTKTVDMTVSGLNGLDTGAEASSTWYFVWLIYNPSTDTYGALFSLSSTSPTMPAGYTAKRRIGSIRNNASSNIILFKVGNGGENIRRYVYTEELSLVLSGGTASSFTTVDLSVYVPTTTSIVYCTLVNKGSKYSYLRPYLHPSTTGTITHNPSSNAQVMLSLASTPTNGVEYMVSAAGGQLSIGIDGWQEAI